LAQLCSSSPTFRKNKYALAAGITALSIRFLVRRFTWQVS
jgi:hypothetical protein